MSARNAAAKLKSPTVTAQLTDLGEKPVKIGMPVEMVTRRIKEDGDERGMLIYGYAKHSLGRKFRPALQG